MKKRLICPVLGLLAIFVFVFASCTVDPSPDGGNGDDGHDDYVYLGEDYSFNKPNSAYSDPEYAEGTVFEYETYNSTVHWIENKGDHIFTLTALPKDAEEGEKFPVLILLHGFNSRYTEYDLYIPYFIESGFACVMFDFRGGAQSGGKSDGDIFNMTLDTEISDVKAVTAFVERQSFADTDNMILVGHSQGGLIASLAAASDELVDKFNGMLLIAPGFSIVTDNGGPYFDGTKKIPSSCTMLYVQMSGDYIRSLVAHKDLYTEIAAFKKPVKILLGTMDGLFTEEDMQDAIEAYGDMVTYERVEGGIHDFSAEILETAYPEQIEPFLLSLIATDS